MSIKRHFEHAVAASIFAFAIAAVPRPANAGDLNAPLVQCQLVTQAATLSNCGNDPLTRGRVHIASDGTVEVTIYGGVGNDSYEVVFRSPDGDSSTMVGAFKTDSKGNGHLRKKVAFGFGKAGAGNLVLTRNSEDQFVSGFGIESAEPGSHAGPDLGGALVACSTVSIPKALSNCGTDSLKSGSVQIDSEDGDLLIDVHGAAAGVSGDGYTAVLRAPDGTELALGTFGTDNHGVGELERSSVFSPGTVGSGTIVIKSGGSDEFLSGFNVTQRPAPVTMFKVNLARCLDVNMPTLHNCGIDPLSQGFVSVNASGKLSINLVGAFPNTTYEVFFRPIDNSGDIDTALSVKTRSNGNGSGSAKNLVPSGTVGSGNFVVKTTAGQIFDEFVTAFTIK
jgi:hypothetical protein